MHNVDHLQKIACDADHYPAPVSTKGSHHSTKRCLVAEGGTVADMLHFNEIVSIDREALTITTYAAVILIDALNELEKYRFQLFTCLEIVNITLGSVKKRSIKDTFFVVDFVREQGQFARTASACALFNLMDFSKNEYNSLEKSESTTHLLPVLSCESAISV
eukprot:IDg15287t1